MNYAKLTIQTSVNHKTEHVAMLTGPACLTGPWICPHATVV